MKKQTKKVLDAISALVKENNQTPTLRELAAEAGYSSTWTVRHHLKKLADAGYIKVRNSISRGIELLQPIHGIPVIGRISAGKPVDAHENIEGYIENVPDFMGSTGMFALKVKGDSMEGEGILDGDVVFVKKQETAVNGDIVAALVEEEATVKKFYMAGDSVKLMPANPRYEPIISKEIKVLGKIIGVVRRY